MKSQLVGPELDSFAAFAYGLVRLANESDASFRLRIHNQNQLNALRKDPQVVPDRVCGALVTDEAEEDDIELTAAFDRLTDSLIDLMKEQRYE